MGSRARGAARCSPSPGGRCRAPRRPGRRTVTDARGRATRPRSAPGTGRRPYGDRVVAAPDTTRSVRSANRQRVREHEQRQQRQEAADPRSARRVRAEAPSSPVAARGRGGGYAVRGPLERGAWSCPGERTLAPWLYRAARDGHERAGRRCGRGTRRGRQVAAAGAPLAGRAVRHSAPAVTSTRRGSRRRRGMGAVLAAAVVAPAPLPAQRPRSACDRRPRPVRGLDGRLAPVDAAHGARHRRPGPARCSTWASSSPRSRGLRERPLARLAEPVLAAGRPRRAYGLAAAFCPGPRGAGPEPSALGRLEQRLTYGRDGRAHGDRPRACARMTATPSARARSGLPPRRSRAAGAALDLTYLRRRARRAGGRVDRPGGAGARPGEPLAALGATLLGGGRGRA